MKPYSKRDMTEDQRIFSYRLSRAPRVSENAFGIMAIVPQLSKCLKFEAVWGVLTDQRI